MRHAWSPIFFGLGVLGLAACASTGPRSADPTLAQLNFQCGERGGFLAPSGRAYTGRPSLDYNCRVSSAEPSSHVDGKP